jgi:hypothetical protein
MSTYCGTKLVPNVLLSGLPEELNITREALSRGWAILAVSSADRRGRRWDDI